MACSKERFKTFDLFYQGMIKGEYITSTEKTSILNDVKATPEEKAKATSSKVISDDAFAIVDLISRLTDAINQLTLRVGR